MDTIRFRKPLLRRRLFVSTSPYCLQKSLLQGGEDLERLCKTSAHEGVWLYAHETQAWYSITKSTSRRETESIVAYSAEQYCVDLSPLGRRVTHVHTHPAAAYKTLVKQLARLRDHPRALAGRPIGTGGWPHYRYANGVFNVPSAQDMNAYFELKRLNPQTDLDFLIFTPIGLCLTRFNGTLEELKRARVKFVDLERMRPDIVEYARGDWSARDLIERFDKEFNSDVDNAIEVINFLRVVTEAANNAPHRQSAAAPGTEGLLDFVAPMFEAAVAVFERYFSPDEAKYFGTVAMLKAMAAGHQEIESMFGKARKPT